MWNTPLFNNCTVVTDDGFVLEVIGTPEPNAILEIYTVKLRVIGGQQHKLREYNLHKTEIVEWAKIQPDRFVNSYIIKVCDSRPETLESKFFGEFGR